MATNGLFIVILAVGLSTSSDVLLPITDFLKPSVKWYEVAVLSLPYILIITSWIRFMISVERDPYQIGTWWWKPRFFIDLIILLVYYLLLKIVSNGDPTDDIQIFTLIPIVFLFYFIWDLFKEKEYQNDTEKLKTIKKRTGITRNYLFIMIFLAIIYNFTYISFFNLEWNVVEFWIETLDWHVDKWTHFLNLNLIFVVIYMFLIFSYDRSKSTKYRQRKST